MPLYSPTTAEKTQAQDLPIISPIPDEVDVSRVSSFSYTHSLIITSLGSCHPLQTPKDSMGVAMG